jgi:hypothetical protein
MLKLIIEKWGIKAKNAFVWLNYKVLWRALVKTVRNLPFPQKAWQFLIS